MNSLRNLAGAALLSLACLQASANSYVEFFRAVNIDNISAVNALLARGFDPNAASDYGQVGLYLAMRDDSPRVAAALLAHPQIKVDLANGSGETALMMAAIKGRLDWVRRLADRGAQINRDGWTPLHYAASGSEPENVKVVAFLLDRGAAIDARAPNGNTALMMASLHGPIDAAELLLARGADARLKNKAGWSAADLARQDGRESLALKLDRAAR